MENENENENEDKSEFEKARKIYPGTKRGLDTEWKYFIKCHKDFKSILPILVGSIQYQIEVRSNATGFVPEWPHFKTYIYNRKWEEEINIGNSNNGQNNLSNIEKIIDEQHREE